jgi:hypothetical protein
MGPSFHTDEFGYNDDFQECGGSSSGDNGGGSLEGDIRDACVDLLNFSPERCDGLIGAGKQYVICNSLNSIGIPVPLC